MKSLLKRLLKYGAYLAAAMVILLAIGVGLFRLFLPRLPEYQDEIKAWAQQAIGVEVGFSGMDARWRLSGPELNFYDARVTVPGTESAEFAAGEVSVGVGLMRLLLDRTLVVERIGVRAAEFDLENDPKTGWRVQGLDIDELTERFAGAPGARNIAVLAEDIRVNYRPADGEALVLGTDVLKVNRDGGLLVGEAIVELPAALGNRLLVTVEQRPGRRNGTASWQVSAEGRALNLAGWSSLQSEEWPRVVGGAANIQLGFDYRAGVVRNAFADVDVTGLRTASSETTLDTAGRVDFERNADGWLLTADDVRLATGAGAWPPLDLRFEAGTGVDGALQSLTVAAGFLRLADLPAILPWLPEPWQAAAGRYGPSGTVRDLTVQLADLQSDTPQYDVGMELEDAGLLAGERWPGVRGFTGSLRASPSGGRLEIDAADMQVDLSRWLGEPVDVERANGTIIWRRNRSGMTVLSDNVSLENADVTSNSSLQISLPADGATPVVDLDSRFSIADIGDARRYLPVKLIKPSLYRWLNSALVAGHVRHGTARFSGPLDKFPFDNDEGVFRIEASLENATLRYSDIWPDVENLNVDLVVDRTRLYSDNNTAINAGNSVVDAEIEIPDLRKPVLTIAANATGTMESVRRFARQSPIATVFGGHLDRVAVDGEAAFSLDLRYPIQNRDDYEFSTRIVANGGSLRVEGLEPPVSALSGAVTVTRRDIGTENLTGEFLGEPVTIELAPAGEALPSYSVIATLKGNGTADGVADGFGVPLTRVVSGATGYEARLKFPRAVADEPMPMQIEIDADMRGVAVKLPQPVGKAADARRDLSLTLEFPAAGEIDAQGSFGDRLKWTLAFLRGDRGWDFDRGVLAAGGAYPGTAGTRGLHITGQIPELRLREWLALASGEGGGAGLADRVRSMELTIEDLYILGQHFNEHRVVVDRSASDWVVQVEGEQAEGTVTLPYDFTSDRTLALDMQRLHLPGSDDNAPKTAITTDPRTVPPLSIRIDDFALGSRQLGRIEAEFERTADGLRADRIDTVDDTFTINGKAGWEVDTREPSGQRTYVEAILKSSDVDTTMARLNSRPGIDGDDMEIYFDVSWAGGPREDFLSSLDGDFVVRFGTGQLDEVEPGAGRMFGLMSVVALPRRLSLDFRDVLDKGFLFDEITGTFNVDDGNAYTCDLSLKGPAADIGIVGRAGLVAEDYDQTAIVSANVGNTLPVVGAVVAGPQVAAALLIFSQIFKKPLQEMGQVYYAIEGSWDEPVVDNANARRFATVSEMAGCLGTAE